MTDADPASLTHELQLLARAAPDLAAGSLDFQGRLTSWNRGAEAMLGGTPAMRVGRPFDELFGEEDAARGAPVRALEMARLDGSAALSVRLRGVHEAIATHLVLEARREEGRVVGFGWLAERAMRREFLGEQFQLALEAAPTGMIVVDLDGRMVRVNEQVAKMFGYERRELLGARVEILVPERLRARHPGFRAGFLACPRARPMGAGRDLYGLSKTGLEIPVEIGLNPLHTAEGEFVLSSIVDITERKRSETALEEQRRSLEQTSREREVLLKEVYHRVKNNLQVISSLLNLQAAQLGDARARELFEESRNRVYTIALVHEHLYQSHDLSEVDFGEYVRHLVSNLQASASASPHVAVRTDVESVRFTVDQAIPCGLIVNELVVNAFKHAYPDQRQGVVTVSLHRSANGLLRLSVSDDGVGMAEPPKAGQRQTLGFELVTKLARQLRGEVELARDAGTCWTITFGVAS